MKTDAIRDALETMRDSGTGGLVQPRRAELAESAFRELDAMTDDELQAKVVELAGVEREYLCCEDSFCPPSKCLYGEDDVYDCIHLREGKDVNDCPEMRRGDLPDFLNDIAAAWTLIEHNPDWRWSVYALDAGGWVATPMRISGKRGAYNLWEHVSEATDGTAPRAITKAFIMAVLGYEDD